MIFMRRLSALNALLWVIDIVVPRFIREEVAFVHDEEEDAYIPICALSDIQPGEDVDAVGVMRSFNIFGFAFFAKLEGELYEYVEEDELEG